MPNMEIDPEVKKGLNEEGFESETPDSGAAILVGKKEEMPQMQEKLEKEGRAKDLASYIRLHKKIVMLANEIPQLPPEATSRIVPGFGSLTDMLIKHPYIELLYVDKEGNIAEVEIKPELIEDRTRKSDGEKIIYNEEMIQRAIHSIGYDLRNLGFNIESRPELIKNLVQNYRARLSDRLRQEEKKKFDF